MVLQYTCTGMYRKLFKVCTCAILLPRTCSFMSEKIESLPTFDMIETSLNNFQFDMFWLVCWYGKLVQLFCMWQKSLPNCMVLFCTVQYRLCDTVLTVHVQYCTVGYNILWYCTDCTVGYGTVLYGRYLTVRYCTDCTEVNWTVLYMFGTVLTVWYCTIYTKLYGRGRYCT